MLDDEVGADLVRESLRWLMEAEVTGLIGGGHGNAPGIAPPGAMAKNTCVRSSSPASLPGAGVVVGRRDLHRHEDPDRAFALWSVDSAG